MSWIETVHDCKEPEFCPVCDRIDEALEQAYGAGHAEQLFRGDETPIEVEPAAREEAA